MADTIRLDIDGPVAVITNNNPDKHNAFDDEMDGRLFEILGELKERRDVHREVGRAVRKRDAQLEGGVGIDHAWGDVSAARAEAFFKRRQRLVDRRGLEEHLG